ncbi:MAG: site-specific integrase [Polyangiaceae bacterium]
MRVTGGIDELPSGRFRYRFRINKKDISGVCATCEEAIATRDEAIRQIASGKMAVTHAASLALLGTAFLASRSGNRGHQAEKQRWNRHHAHASFATRPAITVTRRDVLDWIERLRGTDTAFIDRANKPLSWQTRKHCLNLLRSFFTWAMSREIVDSNPCTGVRIAREDGDEDEGFQDSWYLTMAEQQALLGITLDDDKDQIRWSAERAIVKFAIGTGLRLGEVACLHLADVHLDSASPYIDVRYGSWDRTRERYRSPKGRAGEKKVRKLALFGIALEAARHWLKVLPTYAPQNPLSLMFPTERGARRDKAPRSWNLVRAKLGVITRIGRKPWWHLLRHTCASSLVAGWWGRKWSLEEVRGYLGHSSVKVTERYAHLAESVLDGVAAESEAAFQARRLELVTTPKNTAVSGTILLPSKPVVARSNRAGRAR